MAKKSDELKEMKMTPEMKRKMMGYLVASKGIEIDYTPDELIGEIPEMYLPVYKLKSLTITERRDYNVLEVTDESLDNFIRTHIIGWSNVVDTSYDDLPIIDYVKDDIGCDKTLYDEYIPHGIKMSILTFLLTH